MIFDKLLHEAKASNVESQVIKLFIDTEKQTKLKKKLFDSMRQYTKTFLKDAKELREK